MKREDHNRAVLDAAEVDTLLATLTNDEIEMVRVRLACEYGRYRGLLFRYVEQARERGEQTDLAFLRRRAAYVAMYGPCR